MEREVREALTRAAADGIEFDGLEVRSEGEGFAFATAEGSETVVHEENLDTALGEYGDYVTNWYYWHAVAPQVEWRWAFLRWLERTDERGVPERYDALAEGTSRTWGQLHVSVTLDGEGDDGHGDSGTRRYSLRHVDDADAPADELAARDDPRDARDITTHDERGRFRPLKSAPSLRTGWHFTDLRAAELLETVEAFYPASVANWHREREGELDITHWTEMTERQSGIYGVVQTWNRGEGYDHVNRVAESCCVDSQCVKRREWAYDGETDLDVDGGDGEFPCREPCSVVLSAARQWTKLDGEQSRTYEFELTPSEKEQLEDIVDAVADGRIDEIREADVYDGANRYRARYLRAKLFDNGSLCGVPTEQEGEGSGDEDEEGNATE